LRVRGLTRGLSLSARQTVVAEMSSCLARSMMVGGAVGIAFKA
jgi:hypothetical protein